VALLLVFVACSVTLGKRDDLTQYRIDQLVSDHGWSAVAWEASYLPVGFRLILAQAVAPPAADAVDERVRAYLLGQSGPESGDSIPLDLALASIVQRQLIEAGLASIGPLVAPPVSLAVTEPPRSLVVSPRDEIRTSEWALLDGTMDLAGVEDLESDVDRLDRSALVVPIGGIATYPTLIPPDTPPAFALQTIAHEWTHTALFFAPLGRAYGTSLEARTINETTADIVGAEVAAAIQRRLGVTTRSTAGGADSELRQALRRIRLTVDQMLAAGDIDAAEDYMETERQALVAQGYRIRKLNQAYFAFYGNYAEGPQASTEIPDRLGELRSESTSLADFLSRVGAVTSLSDLRAMTAP
jgi:hypothetical protein